MYTDRVRAMHKRTMTDSRVELVRDRCRRTRQRQSNAEMDRVRQSQSKRDIDRDLGRQSGQQPETE
jgi:hypothetical protein